MIRGVLRGASLAVLALASCRTHTTPTGDAGQTASLAPVSSAVAASDAGAPRAGMVWIPAGALHAGTAADRVPRIADEEMPGTALEMGGFYIDSLPWPNEPNAIPTTNVSRDEAVQLCTAKGKRLCSELEWERACKGPANATYEYGDTYRKEVCGTGAAPEQAARRPTGEHAQCKSAFGVSEMHGGVFEWTASTWGRGSRDGSQEVLRGGNSVAGELVGRCSNAIARSPSKKGPTMGLRCCAGPKGSAEVTLDLTGTPNLTLGGAALAEPWLGSFGAALPAAAAANSAHAWSWIPVANEDLVVVTACTPAPRECALLVGRHGHVLASTATGKSPPEVIRNGDARHLRVRYVEPRGLVDRAVTYQYGRVDLSEAKRP